ncbi:hypothetical protein Clacol_004390 [Clathrus columnatus]|uniref:Uncharacterized protein n=1 Tax=Clathrus columnatus TaxID=1419009 RepID=A0AAV5ABS1_9AGAM|nr:hypothetical protein Clacol_004390 [Clathrus columnatus]
MHCKDTPQLKNLSNSPIPSDDEKYNIYDNDDYETTTDSPLPEDIDLPSSDTPYLTDDTMLLKVYYSSTKAPPIDKKTLWLEYPAPHVLHLVNMPQFEAKFPLEYGQEIKIPCHPYTYKINNFFSIRWSGYHTPDIGPVVHIIASAKIGTIYSHALFDIRPEWLYVPELPNSPSHDPPPSPTHLKEPSDSPKSNSECLPQKRKAWKKRSASEACGIEDSGDGSVHKEAEHRRKLWKLW